MTAENCNAGHKSKQIWIYIHTCKSVFVYCKLYPIPLKSNVKHKAENTYEICNGGNIHNSSCNCAKLVFKVKVRLGMHTVKYEKAYKNMQKHKCAVYNGVCEIKQHSQKRYRKKSPHPQTESEFKKSVVRFLFIICKPHTPAKQKRNQNISRNL